MNEGNYREYGGISCYFHPKEVIVGVCHLCLNERLLIIAAKQGANSKTSKLFGSKHKYNFAPSNDNNSSYDDIPLKYHHDNKNKPKSAYMSLPKFFGIGSLFNARDLIRHHRHRRHSRRKSNHDLLDVFDVVVDDDDATSTSLEEDESFISIKFGDNGVASWDKTSTTVSKEPTEQCSLSWRGQTAVKDATLKGSGGNYYSHKSVVEHPKPRPSLRWRKRIGQLLQVIKWKKSSKANTGGSGGAGNNHMVVRNNKSYIEDIPNYQ